MVKLNYKLSAAESAGFKLSNETRFSFVDINNSQVISPVSCRTFVAEVLWSFLGKGKCPRTDYNNETLNMKTTKLSITFKTKKEENNFISRLPELNAIEKEYNLIETTYQVTDKELTFLVLGDKAWMKVWGITLYTFLLKRITFKDDKAISYTEADYLKAFLSNKDTLMKAIATPKQEEKYETSASNVHSDGFVHLSQQQQDHLNGWIFQ